MLDIIEVIYRGTTYYARRDRGNKSLRDARQSGRLFIWNTYESAIAYNEYVALEVHLHDVHVVNADVSLAQVEAVLVIMGVSAEAFRDNLERVVKAFSSSDSR